MTTSPMSRDRAQQRRDIERRAGRPERDDAAGQRHRRRRQDRQRRGQAAELEHEDQEHQRHRCPQRQAQLRKGARLRQPLAAELDAVAARQRQVSAGATRPQRTAEPRSAPCRRAVTCTIERRFSRVISDDVQLSSRWPTPASGTSVPAGVRSRSPVSAASSKRARSGQRTRTGTSRSDSGSGDDSAPRSAAATCVEIVSVVRPSATGDDGIDRQLALGRAGDLPVVEVDEAGHVGDRGRDAQRLPAQLGFVGAEDAQLDRLGAAFEVVEHVLQHLDELDAHARRRGAAARLRTSSMTSSIGPAVGGLQTDDVVAAAGVGGRGRAQLGAEPPREGLDVGRRGQDGIDVAGERVGHRQRRADGREEVEHEARLRPSRE